MSRKGGEPRRVIRPVREAANPNVGDSSTPKFREDERHVRRVAEVNGGRGFPWYPMYE